MKNKGKAEFFFFTVGFPSQNGVVLKGCEFFAKMAGKKEEILEMRVR